MGLFARVKALCLEQGLTIADLEEKCGISKNSLYRWDKNAPSIDKIVRVATLLDVSIDYLLGLTEIRQPAKYGGLSEEEYELVRSFQAAPPSRQESALALLKAPAARVLNPGVDESNE